MKEKFQNQTQAVIKHGISVRWFISNSIKRISIFLVSISYLFIMPLYSGTFEEAEKLYKQYKIFQDSINHENKNDVMTGNNSAIQDLDKAEIILRKIYVNRKNEKNLSMLADIVREQCSIYFILGQFEKSISKCEAYIKLGSEYEKDTNAHYALYLANFEIKNRDKAAKHLLKVTALKYKEDSPEYENILREIQLNSFDKNSYFNLHELGDTYSRFIIKISGEYLKLAKENFNKCGENSDKNCRYQTLLFLDRGLNELAQMKSKYYKAIRETKELISAYTKFYEKELDISTRDMNIKEDVYVAGWERFNLHGAPNIDKKIKEKLRILNTNPK